MRGTRIPLGPHRPDLPALVNAKGLVRALNALPVAGGYHPMPSLATMGLGSLAARARGAISGVTASGNSFHFAGDQTKLYRITVSGLVDASRTPGYNCTGESRWAFSQFGDFILATNPAEPLQLFTVGRDTNFANVVDGENSIPSARHLGVIGQHLVVGNYYDAYEGLVTDGVRWAAIGNPLSWPEPGTDLALSLQSDSQRFGGDGGWVMGVVDSAEVGGVFQERSIQRLDYRGGDVIFEINRVEPKRGLLVPGLAIPFGRMVFYCSEDGFYLWDYSSSTGIGDEVVNRTFLADIDSAYFDRVSWAMHPDKPIAFIAYPGQGNVSGTPNRMLVYNFSINQFATLDVEVDVVCQVIPPTGTLDDPPPEDIDVGSGSFDDRGVGLGATAFGAYSSAHTLSQWSGPALTAEFETGDQEHAPGQRAFVSEIRPLVTGGEASVQIAALGKRADAVRFGRSLRMQDDGVCYARSDGRYHRYRVIVEGGFTDAVGLDVSFVDAGGR